jgi:hypothetical protein
MTYIEAMREAHEEDPRFSVVPFAAESVSTCGSSSIDGGGKRKRC